MSADEASFLEDNIATVAFHLAQPGAKLHINSGRAGGLAVDPGEVLQEIARRLSTPAQSSWQPIETAPKDRFILLYCPEDQSRWLAKWQGNDRWYGCDIEHGLTREGYSAGDPDVATGWAITHWMDAPPPLPSPLLTPARGDK